MDYKKYNDYELLYKVQENDDYSEKLLYEKYFPVLKGIASEYYHQYCHYGYDMDDFIQEAYLSFQKAVLKYDEQKDYLFYTFVQVCVHRGLLSFCRNISNTRKNLSYYYMVSIEDNPVVDEKADIERLFHQSEMEDFCNRMIFELSDELGPIFELKYNGFNFLEIATLLDIPRSTVEFRFRKIKQYLRKLLES